MEFTIRAAVLSDREKIRPLQKEIADLHHIGRPDLFKTEARYFTDESFAERLAAQDHYVFVAESAGEVIGYAFANIIKYRGHSTYIDFDSFYIDDICVLEKYQRHGVGEALFMRCLKIAKTEKCHNIDLGVFAFNKDAITFYERMGMRERMRRMELVLE